MALYRPIPRRKFFQVSAAAALAVGVLGACSGRNGPWRFLTDAEAELVDSIAAQIIPEDQDPGGRTAVVVNFIDIQLTGHYKRYQEIYRQGLARLEKTSLALYQMPWVSLPFGDQFTLLSRLEKGEAPEEIWDTVSSTSFFDLICEHCLQGYYGSPRHGGNRNYVSYRMIGIDYPQLCGRRQPA